MSPASAAADKRIYTLRHQRRDGGADESSTLSDRGCADWRHAPARDIVCASLLRSRMGRQELQRLHRSPHETRLAESSPVFLRGRQRCRWKGGELVVSGLFASDAETKRHRPAGVSRQHRQRGVGQRLSRQEWHAEYGRGRHAQVFGWRAAASRPAAGLRTVAMNLHLRYVAACAAALTLSMALFAQAGAQTAEYTIKVLPP